MTNIHIKGGRLVDPKSGLDARQDLFIADGRIAALGKPPAGFRAARTLEASNHVVCPGLIDLSARLREPGFEYKATLESEMQAAIARTPPLEVRIGIDIGPVVAGVIGERKFAYDVWGDTVNLASRLQEAGEPGQVLVSQRTAADVADRSGFGPAQMIDIKGKGATPVRVLLPPHPSSEDGERASEAEPS